MKKISALLVILCACASGGTPAAGSGGAETGAATALAASEAFLKAVREGDLQAMSAVWGDKRGSARRFMAAQELQDRLAINMCYLSHDRASQLETAQRGDTTLIRWNLTKGPLTRPSLFRMLKGPRDRWYVVTFDPVPDLCRPQPAQAPARTTP